MNAAHVARQNVFRARTRARARARGARVTGWEGVPTNSTTSGFFCHLLNTGQVFLVFAARYGRFAPVAGFVCLAVDHPLEITSDSVPLSSRPVGAAMNGTAAEDAC